MAALHEFVTIAAQNPLSNYWAKMVDPRMNPFRGLYQINAKIPAGVSGGPAAVIISSAGQTNTPRASKYPGLA